MPYFTKKKFYLAQTGVGVPVHLQTSEPIYLRDRSRSQYQNNFSFVVPLTHTLRRVLESWRNKLNGAKARWYAKKYLDKEKKRP